MLSYSRNLLSAFNLHLPPHTADVIIGCPPPAGGLAETPLHGGLVGPTFACVIGIQFRNLRKCDRFWYESGNPLIRFTESQLAEVRKITLAKVM